MKKWDEKDLAQLSKMWIEGFSSGDLAERFGVSRNSILGKIRALGLLGKGGTRSFDKYKLVRTNYTHLRKQGMSREGIAKTCDININTLDKVIKNAEK